MSISAVSANPPVFQPNAQQQSIRQDFQSLTSALQSGDLAGAQKAYSTLMQDNPQLASGGQDGSSNNPFQQALSSIGQALQNNDIGSAQNALTSLQQNMKAHHGHHHHHQSAGAQSTDSSTTSNSASLLSASSSSINFLA